MARNELCDCKTGGVSKTSYSNTFRIMPTVSATHTKKEIEINSDIVVVCQ